jgi:hypothetical protein
VIEWQEGEELEAGPNDVLLYGRRSKVSKAFLEAEQLGRLVTAKLSKTTIPFSISIPYAYYDIKLHYSYAHRRQGVWHSWDHTSRQP